MLLWPPRFWPIIYLMKSDASYALGLPPYSIYLWALFWSCIWTDCWVWLFMCFDGIIWVGGGEGDSLMCCFWFLVPDLSLIFLIWLEGLGEVYYCRVSLTLLSYSRRKLPPTTTPALAVFWFPTMDSSSTGDPLPGLISSLRCAFLAFKTWCVGGLWSGLGLTELLTSIREALSIVTLPCVFYEIPGDGLNFFIFVTLPAKF